LTLFLIGGILGENLKNYSKLSKKGVKIAIFTPFFGDLNRNESEPLQMDNWRYFYIGGKIY